MKTILSLAAILAMNAANAADSTPVLSAFGATVKSAFGATVTGRDFRNEPSESKGGDSPL